MNSTLSLFLAALGLAKQAAPLLPEIVSDVPKVTKDIEKIEQDAPTFLKNPSATMADVEKLFQDVETPISTVIALIQGSKSIKIPAEHGHVANG